MNYQNDTFSIIKRQQQDLRKKIQQTQNLVLDNKKDHTTLAQLNNLIYEEQKILKHLQIDICKLQKQTKQLYTKNILQRLKKKIKQHKQYVNTYFGKGSYQSHNPFDIKNTVILENQNLQLQTNKMTIYQNQKIQNLMSYNLKYQGQQLNTGFEDHTKIRSEADEAQGAINLIHKAILKRKIMFISLILLFIIGVIIVIVKKVNKAAEILS